MGGKTTQQRIAGNAKPTNSGRIRELMINKQQGLSNIITFSTLANNPPSFITSPPNGSPKKKNELENQTISRDSKTDQDSSQNESLISAENTNQDSPTNAGASIQQSPDKKSTLIVRRIGNRDYFTRVKVPNDSSNHHQINNPKSGVHKFPDTNQADEPSLIKQSSEQSISENHGNDEESDANVSVPSSETQRDESIVSEQGSGKTCYDFDTLLAELTSIQDKWDRSNSEAISFNDLSELQINQESELLRILRTLVREFNEDLSIEDWDLVIQSNYKWICLMTNTSNLLESSNWTLLCINILKFIHDLVLFAKQRSQPDSEPERELPMIHLLIKEWNNFHSSKAYQDLIILFFKIVSRGSSTNLDNNALSIIQALANITLEVDAETILFDDKIYKFLQNEKIEFDPYFKTPDNHKFCNIDQTKFRSFLPLCNLLKTNQRVIMITAHSILSRVMDKIGESVRDNINENNEDLESISLMPPEALMAILTTRDSIMTALLSDYKVGDISVTIEPNTDSYTCTLSYLFVWDLIIQFINAMNKEDGHRLIHCLKRLGFISRLLDNIFMLLPPLGEKDSLRFGLRQQYGNKSSNKRSSLHTESWYLMEYLKSRLQTALTRPKNEIELTALHLYFSIALHMPVTVRKWFNNNSNKRLSNLVNEYTVKHISQVICALEMESVQDKCQERANEDKSNNLFIKARPNSREVHAVYTRDEFRMELTIKLPINYPLGSVQIDAGKRVAVTDLKWRSWLLQLTTFLSHQNGPILDGIDLWRKNIDKRFEGVEKCMICFSILHSNYQLPRKRCITCIKMFHNICLYKWFESSGNTTCPHCRSLW